MRGVWKRNRRYTRCTLRCKLHRINEIENYQQRVELDYVDAGFIAASAFTSFHPRVPRYLHFRRRNFYPGLAYFYADNGIFMDAKIECLVRARSKAKSKFSGKIIFFLGFLLVSIDEFMKRKGIFPVEKFTFEWKFLG